MKKAWRNYQKLREAKAISKHFSSYLSPQIALSESLKDEVYKIRHDVYCKELKLEPLHEQGIETDEFDAFSKHCLIKHLNSENYAGTIRLVTPQKEGELLPIEKYCSHSITDEKLSPKNMKREEICEFSRLAVPAQFRRRAMDKFAGAATGVIDENSYSENELRCFPFIAIGLYMSAASLGMGLGLKHAFVMMEPRLARSLGFIGIKFVQIGPAIDYHGTRAPYYINAPLLFKNLSPGFRVMLNNLQDVIDDQLSVIQPK
ncbi:PEP-CTERM/exosortase system-associated acyltransferase [Alteromonas sp. 5E99-2]|uniref:PEP-CTERM/exosortase system-associated acyltransferase n=1 Tax=Alteromonas sp. 5E99-2 TaxID=2817683 RepID=UPI00325BDFBC